MSELYDGIITKQRPSMFYKEFPNKNVKTEITRSEKEIEKLDLDEEKVFREFNTSFSQLRYYDRCPYDFKMRFIYGFNPSVVSAFGYGKTLHNILSIIHTRYKSRPPNLKELEDIVEKNTFLRYANERQLKILKDKIKMMVLNYCESNPKIFNQVINTEKEFEFLIDKALISGAIDLIKKSEISENDPKNFEIIDFKYKESSEMAIDREKQLKLYAIASKKVLKAYPSKAYIHNLEENTISEVNIDKNELQAVEEEIKEIINNILNKHFPKNIDKAKCEICDWKLICNNGLN